MKTLVFVGCIAILAIISGFFLYRAQPCGIEMSFVLNLSIFPDGSRVSGTGWIFNKDVNFSVLKWPGLGYDNYNLKLSQRYTENKTRTNPVKFDIIIHLNQTEKVIEISDFRNAGTYTGTVNCYFDSINRGGYYLTISLSVEGETDKDPLTKSIVFVP
jgi:hypothetical protein